MQRATKAEFQMLREIAWFYLPITPCYFCKNMLIHEPPEGSTFGHRRHPSIDGKITFHHKDHNRNNNKRENLAPSHSSCHRQYHANLRRTSEPELDADPSDS
jgi:hypothetical protein